MIYPVLLATLAAAGAIYLRHTRDTIPTPEGGKTVSFSWKHNNTPLSFSIPLYQSYYDWYKKQKPALYIGRESESIREIITPVCDPSLPGRLASKIRSLARQEGMTRDREAEIAVSFVQAIDYDFTVSPSRIQRYSYPYEVLYKQKGNCAEKAFLLVMLLNELGFETAVFHFSEERHIGAGIGVPEEYSNYDSGFAYIETSDNFRIGSVPVEFPSISGPERAGYSSPVIEKPVLYPVSGGEPYLGIIGKTETRKALSRLKSDITSLQGEINKKTAELKSLRERINELRNFGHTQRHAERLSSLTEEYNLKVEDLNRLKSRHNSAVDTYNHLARK